MKHGATAHRKFCNAVRLARAHLPDALPAGFFMTDPDRVPDPLAIIAALPDGIGVIVRHFGRPGYADSTAAIVQLCQRAGRPVLVAADPSLARDLQADGVHWPSRLIDQARQERGPFRINTMSAHSIGALRAAGEAEMDAAILSAVFASGSPTAGPPIGITGLAAAVSQSPVAVYGLGGIGRANVESVARLAGFATVSGFGELVSDRNGRPRT